MKNIQFKIKKLKKNAILPAYQTNNSAGMDISACMDKPVILKSMERKIIPTGLAIELPPGYEAQIRARSGLSIKNGITVVNGVGTIDSDYRGEVGVLIVNLGGEPFVIEHGMRIAQMVIAKYEKITWQESKSLEDSERGVGGYGSTGLN